LLEKDRKYFRQLFKGDVCTKATDFQALLNYCADLRKDLIICRRSATK